MLLLSLQCVYAKTIGIGVYPVVFDIGMLSFYKEMCFFNAGDTDAVYRIKGGSAIVVEDEFLVPKNTSMKDCVKKNVIIITPGNFYVEGYPVGYNYNGGLEIIRRVEVKVNKFFRLIDYFALFFISITSILLVYIIVRRTFLNKKTTNII